MVDMKLTKSEQEGDTLVSEDNEYPYGIRLHLGNEELEKLGLDLKDVGDECLIKASGVVTDVSQSASESGEHKSMTIQITDMEVEPADGSSNEEKLYGKEEG